MASLKKTTSIKKSSSTEVYSLFIEGVHLLGIALESSSINIQRNKFLETVSRGEVITNEISAEHKISSFVEKEIRKLQITFRCKVEFKHESDKEPLLTIACTHTVNFQLDKFPTKSNLERFAMREANLVHWPYFRLFVSDISSRMSIPPLVIPLTSELRADS